MAKKDKKQHNPESEAQPPAQPPEGEPKQPETPMVGLTFAEYDELQKQAKQAQESLDGWQRERADFSNYKRRIERDQVQMSFNITGQVIRKYLVILDDLERALKTRPTEGEGAVWAAGVEMIYRKLGTILDAEGVRPIPAEIDFDPNLHEAITHEDNPDFESGQIIEVVQTGYIIGDRVLRPALVRVAR
jgi:molecular chaperone GrpE